MARGFGTGVLWGIVVVGAGLAALSQLAPPPPKVTFGAEVATLAPAPEQGGVAEDQAVADKAAADQTAADQAAADQAAADKAAADKAAADKAAADKAAADKAAADKVAADQAAADVAAQHKADTEVPLTADTSAPEEPPLAPAESPAAPALADALPAPGAPNGVDEIPSLTDLDQALTVPAAEPDPAQAEPLPSEPEGPTDALSEPGQPEGQLEPQHLPQIAPVADPDVDANPPEVVVEPAEDEASAPESAPTVQDVQPTLPAAEPLADKLPSTVMDKTVPGVKTGELPQIGTPAVEEPVPEQDVPPVQLFARDFVPEGKPLFVILLRDIGAGGMAREELAKLPFPVSFVVDPLASDAKEASAVYRAAGQEVLTLANGIPNGAEASDLETTFATLSSILPESVAVIDQDLGGFQDQRALATLVLPVIKGEGRGLVTYDRGLNAADQIARREGMPAAMIFRRLDGGGETKSTIRRYLDRAAFKAAQEGSVVVLGDTKPETVAAILEWTVEGRASTVTLAPVTAVLK